MVEQVESLSAVKSLSDGWGGGGEGGRGGEGERGGKIVITQHVCSYLIVCRYESGAGK